ncbi:hypothetical protein [Absidia glauca]|uniref:RING-type domain-containing protein n=1 Tax=Absidia glauca TaxID=4829 RepID=A0A168Q6K5_ABSGL|nr:hypothetical protein [Absidia glauca]
MALHPYFCHLCRVYFRIGTNLHDPKCLYCDTRFIEEAESVDEPSESEEYDDDDDDDDDDMEDQTALYLTLRSAPRLAQDGHQGTQQARWVVHFADDDNDNSDNDNDTRIEEDKDDSLEDALEAMSLDDQQWETEDEYGNVSSSISTSRPGSVIAASASSSSSLSFASSSSSPHQPTGALLSSPTSSSSSSSSSSSLYRPPSSSFSSPSSSSSLPRIPGSHQQQNRSLSSTNHRSSTRQDSFFRIERLLDIIYQGYSESENEHDDTHRSFMDNLMEIFSDPMETPQASNSDDLDQCIERLSRRTLLQDNSETKLECTICQESFGANAEILQMPCQHEYHTVCISQWLHVNATCPICRCPVIMERSDDLGPPPAFSLGSLTTRRHSYPSITDEDTQVFDEDDDDEDDDYHDGDDEDEVLSDYYEMIDPPPMWARSSSSATVTRYLCTYHHLS